MQLPPTAVDLDPRLVSVLSVPPYDFPQSGTTEERLAYSARRRELREKIRAHEIVATTCEDIALSLAKLVGVRAPRRPETIELLSTLVLDIQVILGAKEAYVMGGLRDFGGR